MRKMTIRPFRALTIATVVLPMIWAAAFADAAATENSGTIAIGSGQAVYQHVCQGCHMPGGKGAVGAGAGFPAFAGDAKLESSGYPIYVVLNGLGGMPWFNGALSDGQIADVINYIRTHFGNHYSNLVSAADIAAARGPAPKMEH